MKQNHLRKPRLAGAFTLIELMVVIMIMCIVVGLIIGVAHYINQEAARKETIGAEAIVVNAINAYIDKHTTPPAQAVVPIGGNGQQWGYFNGASNVPQAARNISMMNLLTAEPTCVPILAHLPSSCIGNYACSGNLNTPYSSTSFAASGPVVLDGYGTPFDYQDGITNPPNTADKKSTTPGSVTGSFVVISAGPDKIFNDPFYGVSSADDIRSDVH
jgi:prepilin-type N-terminal cleavage/methylation domain-containing protein